MDHANHLLQDIQQKLTNCDDVTYLPIHVQGHECTVIYIQSIINLQMLQEQIATPLLSLSLSNPKNLRKTLDEGAIFTAPYTQNSDPENIANCIVKGSAAVYVAGYSHVILFDIPMYHTRAVEESQNEQVVIGPREAFIEDIEVNLSLIRHKIKHPDLKVVHYTIGSYTQTTVYVLYIEGLCKQEVLDELDEQLKKIDIDGIFGMGYISEQFKASRLTPFPQFQYTERPDSVASSLLEGRVSIMLDGTPSTLIVPVSIFSLLQSSEDYYQSFYSASWMRIIRVMFALVSLMLPSLYVAITTFQPEIIPTDLLITIAAARENIPFSALTEAFIMELTFEALREAGTRIPKPVGQTISIIGAIVIGQAAVEAGIVSTPMVIVVSITGIAAYIVPHYELGLAFRLLRFPLLILGGTTGLLGVLAATFIVYGHLTSLNTFGTPYMYPLSPLVFSDWKDMLVRVPSYWMTKRPANFASKNKRRQTHK
ncbi:spore germination protein [Paenibacillus faecalis]|uniref:spore germination protein n=1 Tax=Paenibacillus faecalis TaxID=2079532 RepID=UPI000D0F6C03|nr:spore germination protein [Paenibacillus faecalis]